MIVTLHQSKQEAEQDENGVKVEIDAIELVEVIVAYGGSTFIRLPKFETTFYKVEGFFICGNIDELFEK